MEEEDWQLNLKKKTINKRKLSMQNLFIKKNNKISINPKYLRTEFDSLLNGNFVFISFTDNYHYENYTEEEFSKINDYFKGRNITSNNFTKISINDNIKNPKI